MEVFVGKNFWMCKKKEKKKEAAHKLYWWKL